MPSYKLTYFNGRGRAELTRLIFAAAGAQFEDERVADWPGTAKADAPLGQLPYLTVDGVKVPQSLAFARLVARRFNMTGSDDLEQAKTDAVVDSVSDLQNAYYLKVFKAKEDRDAVVAQFLAEDAVSHLEKVEKIVTLYGTEGYSVGSSLTWSDLHLFDVTSTVMTLNANLLDKYPRIQAVRKTVESNEKVSAYLKSRPETPF
uniref:glutathione transferase n=1 Tax=Brachionus calyciflorus TaxID=104777 RepID=A0A3G2JSD2_9BILA|nr:glutathione S-transferase S12/13 [Brachionus calyciflorus]